MFEGPTPIYVLLSPGSPLLSGSAHASTNSGVDDKPVTRPAAECSLVSLTRRWQTCLRLRIKKKTDVTTQPHFSVLIYLSNIVVGRRFWEFLQILNAFGRLSKLRFLCNADHKVFSGIKPLWSGDKISVPDWQISGKWFTRENLISFTLSELSTC